LFSVIVGAKRIPRRRVAVVLRGRGRELAVEETHRAFMKGGQRTAIRIAREQPQGG
jgi:hypothetical protein